MDGDAESLFDVPELLAVPHRIGRAEAGLIRALQAGHDAGLLLPEDAGLIGAALVGARQLDAIDTNPGMKTVYAYAAAATPYRETLQALRLPAAVMPSDPRAPAAAEANTPDWLRDAFGTPSD
jgi:hypothetical protein